jgi:transposase-like protein
MSETRWTEKEGREVVRRWRRSGDSLAAFAREEGLDPQRVRYWCERVEPKAKRGKKRVRRRGHRSSGSRKIVPGVVVGVGVHAPVSVQLLRGVVIEAQAVRDIEPTWVAELVQLLEQTR